MKASVSFNRRLPSLLAQSFHFAPSAIEKKPRWRRVGSLKATLERASCLEEIPSGGLHP